jgi:hypothetical protein
MSAVPTATSASRDVLSLVDALDVESRLLSELNGILRRQREGIARDDLQAIDDSVFAAHRILGTLKEAQRRRRTMLEILTGTQTTPLEDLEESLGREVTPALLAVRDRLNQEARALAREIRVNRRVLQGAMEQGSRMIQVLRGAAEPNEPGAAREAGALIDQRV